MSDKIFNESFIGNSQEKEEKEREKKEIERLFETTVSIYRGIFRFQHEKIYTLLESIIHWINHAKRQTEDTRRRIAEGTTFGYLFHPGIEILRGVQPSPPISWIARSFYMHGSRAIPWPRAEQLFEVSVRNGKLMVPLVHPSLFLSPVGLYRRRTGGTILLCTGICGEPSLRDKINTVVRFFFACPIFLRYIVPRVFFFVLLFFSHNFSFFRFTGNFLARAFSLQFPSFSSGQFFVVTSFFTFLSRFSSYHYYF